MHPRRVLALLLLFAHLINQVLAQVVVGHAELLPPVGQHFLHFANIGTQAHEVKGRPKARLLHHAKRRAADAFFETRLHHPDLAHIAGQFAAARNVANARVEHIVNGVHQGRMRMLLLLHAAGPSIAHIGPQHTRQQEARRHRFTLTHAAVSVLERGVHKGLVGTFHHHIEQGINTTCHAELLQLLDGSQGMTGLQQFEHLIKQAALRHIGQQLLRLDQRCRSLALQRKTQ